MQSLQNTKLLINEAKNLGANVTLISGPVHLDPITDVEMINVESTLDMKNALMIVQSYTTKYITT